MMKLVSRIFRRTDWYVTSSFGYRKVNNILEFHNGTDYGTHKQKWELYAIEPGTVISCGTAGDGAQYIWVNYPRLGKKLLHYHLDHIEVEAGDEVQEGTLLGTTGETGSTNGIHLHLGMQPSAANIYEDPHEYEYSYYANATMNTAATVYGGPNTTLYAPIGSVIKKGQVQVINKENNFFFIRYWTDKIKLKRGYVDIAQVTIDPLIQIVDVTKTFKGNNNLVYPQSTLYADSNIATGAPIGTISELEGVTEFTPPENNMHFIEYGTPEGIKRGYIQGSELIRKEGGLAIAIASNGTSVYYTDSFESQSGSVRANEYVTLLQTNSTASYIEYNTQNGRTRGYVANDSLQILDTDDVPELNYTKETHKTTKSMISYSGPTEKYATVGSVSQDEVVTKLSSSTLTTYNGYSFIEYSTAEGTKKRGYVASSGLVAYVPPVDPVEMATTTVEAYYRLTMDSDIKDDSLNKLQISDLLKEYLNVKLNYETFYMRECEYTKAYRDGTYKLLRSETMDNLLLCEISANYGFQYSDIDDPSRIAETVQIVIDTTNTPMIIDWRDLGSFDDQARGHDKKLTHEDNFKNLLSTHNSVDIIKKANASFESMKQAFLAEKQALLAENQTNSVVALNANISVASAPTLVSSVNPTRRENAVKYANQNADKDVPNSGDGSVPFPTDLKPAPECTIFISHCLLAGGYEMVGNDAGSSSWYYKNSRPTGTGTRSASWSGVNELFAFLVNNKDKDNNGPKALRSHAECNSTKNDTFSSFIHQQVKIGDILQIKYNWDNGGSERGYGYPGYGHSLLVVGFGSLSFGLFTKEIRITGRTRAGSARVNVKLREHYPPAPTEGSGPGEKGTHLYRKIELDY